MCCILGERLIQDKTLLSIIIKVKEKIHIATYCKCNYQALLCSFTFKKSPINRVSKFVLLLQISCSKVLKHCWTCICTEAVRHKQISGSHQMVQTSKSFVALLFVSLWHCWDKWSTWLFMGWRILLFSKVCRWSSEASPLLDFHVPSISLHQKFTLYCYMEMYNLH